MIHLTYTGHWAGKTFCQEQTSVRDEFHHMNISALSKDEYRAKVCPVCLAEYDAIDYED